jgi:5-(carboxyamino)imidazole ribonucleotide mutase
MVGAMKNRVAVVMGSDSDLRVMKDAVQVLKDFGVSYEISILSAHRTPEKMIEYGKKARLHGLQVIIAGAGGSAHLPGMLASVTELPVIGVPVSVGALRGEDSLLSIVQMPKGVPVASVAIDNASNAALLAIQICASGGSKPDDELLKKMAQYKKEMAESVDAKNERIDDSLKSFLKKT